MHDGAVALEGLWQHTMRYFPHAVSGRAQLPNQIRGTLSNEITFVIQPEKTHGCVKKPPSVDGRRQCAHNLTLTLGPRPGVLLTLTLGPRPGVLLTLTLTLGPRFSNSESE